MTANLLLTWLSYILLCHASSNISDGHKPTYELVISFFFSLGCSKVFFTAFYHASTKNCESQEFILGWPENIEDSSIESFDYYFNF